VKIPYILAMKSGAYGASDLYEYMDYFKHMDSQDLVNDFFWRTGLLDK